jgi:glycosyltransferase involved in cell wall biosynthesis
MKTFLFCSLYYRKSLATGANKRFENFIFYFQNFLSKNENILVVVKKENIPEKLRGLDKISFIEIPSFLILDRLFSYIYLSIKFYRNKKMVVVSDFMPIPNKALSKHLHYQLVHDIRNFTQYKRSSYLNTADRIQMNQWRKSSKIITVSNFTKSELIDRCSIKSEDIFVSPNGLDDRYYNRKSKLERDIDITYIATFEKRKNHRYLMRALSKYSGNKKIKLCLIGKDLGTFKDIKDLESKLKNIDVSFIESIPDEKSIIAIYDRTKLFVYPSLYEGFGMPLIEAIARGCRVLCSDIPVFREVAEDIPKYFNLGADPQFLMDLIEKELNSEDLTKIRGSFFLDKYRWSKIAEEFYLNVKNEEND